MKALQIGDVKDTYEVVVDLMDGREARIFIQREMPCRGDTILDIIKNLLGQTLPHGSLIGGLTQVGFHDIEVLD